MASELTLEQKTWHQLECAANSTGDIEVAMVSLPIAQVKALVEGKNNRPAPAATDTGLEEIVKKAMQDEWNEICADTGFHPLDIGHERGKRLSFTPLHWATAIASSVRSQAEELLAAERVKYEAIVDSLRIQLDRVNALETDNAAQAARIKELEQINAMIMGDDENAPRYTTKRLKQEIARATEALEAKLAAAKKALEDISGKIGAFHDAETDDARRHIIADIEEIIRVAKEIRHV
ncbi:MAG: hypothetical protein PBV01_11645 [Brucella anthropi]